MFKNIEIGNTSVGMLANAATPYRYKQVFREDLLRIFKAADTDDTGAVVDMSSKLAFIMSKAAAREDMAKLNADAFFDWLGQFEQMDLLNASGEIIGLWLDTTKTSSEPKKN